MEHLKTIIKYAIKSNGQKIIFELGETPSVVINGRASILDNFNINDEHFLNELIKFLLPQEDSRPNSPKPVETMLSISNAFKFRVLIGLMPKPWVYLYFPNNDALFDQDFRRKSMVEGEFTQAHKMEPGLSGVFSSPPQKTTPKAPATTNLPNGIRPQIQEQGPTKDKLDSPGLPNMPLSFTGGLSENAVSATSKNAEPGLDNIKPMTATDRSLPGTQNKIQASNNPATSMFQLSFSGNEAPQAEPLDTATFPSESEDQLAPSNHGAASGGLDFKLNQEPHSGVEDFSVNFDGKAFAAVDPSAQALPDLEESQNENASFGHGNEFLLPVQQDPDRSDFASEFPQNEPSDFSSKNVSGHTHSNTPRTSHAQTMRNNAIPAMPMPYPVVPADQSASEVYSINFGSDEPLAKERSKEAKIDIILKDMIGRKASDLHLTIGQPVMYRIDGDMMRVGDEAINGTAMEALLLSIMPERNIREFAVDSDTDFAYEIPGVGRFRVNMFRDRNGVGCVMRHIPSNILTMEDLGLSPVFKRFCYLSKGLVVVTGPTGSGKSTTLAAMIDHINKARKTHIITIEDPIEFVHPQQKALINQREIGRHTQSFTRALRAALREDPDIVLIGEMRDLETVAIAIETAETGHLVFGTLHTNTAVSTIDRIIDQFPTDQQEQIRMMLAASLKGVISQTLLKKKAGGRAAAHEILVVNDAVAAMIREGKNHMIANHMATQKADGNLLLNDALISLIESGKVEPIEAYIKAIDKKDLIEKGKRKNIVINIDQQEKAA